MLKKVLPYKAATTGSTAPREPGSVTTNFEEWSRQGYAPSTALTIYPSQALTDEALGLLLVEVGKLRHEVDNLKHSGQLGLDSSRLERMRRIAESLLERNRVPAGNYIAVTFDGTLLEVAEDLVQLLRQVHNRTEDLFIWKVGTGPIDSW